MPKLKPYEAVLILVGSLAFFAGAVAGYLHASGSEALVYRLYISFFSGAGSVLLAETVAVFLGAAVVASLNLARVLRQRA